MIAGPGSGKTRVIVNRISHLIEKELVDPTSILAVTFTKKAANEMKERIALSLKSSPPSLPTTPPPTTTTTTSMEKKKTSVTVSTLHSFCSGLLRRYGSPLYEFRKDFSIYDDNDSKKIIKRILASRNQNQNSEDKTTLSPTSIYESISQMKKEGFSTVSNEASSSQSTISHMANAQSSNYNIFMSEILKEYNAIMLQCNALDFDDLILHTLHLLLTPPTPTTTPTPTYDSSNVQTSTHMRARSAIRKRFKHILVDEWQDIDKSQYQLLKELVIEDDNDEVIHIEETSSEDITSNVSKEGDNQLTRQTDNNGEDEYTGNVNKMEYNVVKNPHVSDGYRRSRTLFVVGDACQTIYTWRGANVETMQRFSIDFPDCITCELTRNYRSTKGIVTAARHLMSRSTIAGVSVTVKKDDVLPILETDGSTSNTNTNTNMNADVKCSEKEADTHNTVQGTSKWGGNVGEEEEGEEGEGEREEEEGEFTDVSIVKTFDDEDQASFIAHMIDYLISPPASVPTSSPTAEPLAPPPLLHTL